MSTAQDPATTGPSAAPTAGPTAGANTEPEVAPNQAGELSGYNAFLDDQAFVAAMEAFGAAQARDRLGAFGAQIGSAKVIAAAEAANRHPPEWQSHDRTGNRLDRIAFHPAWHELMTLARGARVHSLAWTGLPKSTPSGKAANDIPAGTGHLVRGGLSYLLNQGENGTCCPITMTFASVAALRHAPDLLARFAPAILSTSHDPRPLPPAGKAALSVGMAMTEKQGGSDLRQTRTTARRGGGQWLLDGHKWFFSAPHSDLFLTLARSESGISCFLAQGWCDDGRRNGLYIQRLKDKCGNRSNASAEVEFRGLGAHLIGEEGHGIATILGMAHLTRMDCAISAAAIMRQALTQAIHHCRQRSAFGRPLIAQPLMTAVLADLALDSEAFLWAGLRLAQTQDGSEAGDEAERLLGRLLIPAGKYLACKRAPAFVAECLECLGGNGYIETHPLARLYREAPLNGIWEGSGNIICLDVLRAARQAPDSLTLWLDETRKARGASRDFDRALAGFEPLLRDLDRAEPQARLIVERMARLSQAALMLRHAPDFIAEAFCRARLSPHGGRDYGASTGIHAAARILERAAVGSVGA